MDITKLPPDTILTEEMLEPKQSERILVIENPNQSYEKIHYNGFSELKAYVKYKRIAHSNKLIVKANITYSDVYRDVEFIINYEILDVIKKGF